MVRGEALLQERVHRDDCNHWRPAQNGPVRGQLFTAGNLESVCDGEIGSQQRKTNVMREAFQQTAFASYTAEAL